MTADLDPAAILADDERQERDIRALLESDMGRSIEADDYRSLLRLLDAARAKVVALQERDQRARQEFVELVRSMPRGYRPQDVADELEHADFATPSRQP